MVKAIIGRFLLSRRRAVLRRAFRTDRLPDPRARFSRRARVARRRPASREKVNAP
jgi:hypothetical protein